MEVGQTRGVRHFGELGFSVIATQRYDYSIDYVVYRHDGQAEDGSFLFHKAGEVRWPFPVATMEDAEPYLHGEVKWDGCSNWQIDENERMPLHFCEKEEILNLGRIMVACWEWTAELLETWDDLICR